MSDSIETRALRWATGGRTGVSSEAILRVMTGQAVEDGYCYPHDSSDFDRCAGLLAAVPEFRSRLDEMRKVGPEWAALVDSWTDLEAARARGEDIYDRMQSILRPIETKRPGLVRLGEHASLYIRPQKVSR